MKLPKDNSKALAALMQANVSHEVKAALFNQVTHKDQRETTSNKSPKETDADYHFSSVFVQPAFS